MRQNLRLLGGLLLVVPAVVVASAWVRTRSARVASRGSGEIVPYWHHYASGGHRMGSADAAATIVLFTDFQCPFCLKLHDDLNGIRRKYGSSVAIVYRSFPLSGIHPYARGAAVAAECAWDQDRFEQMYDVLYHEQRAIGTRPWWYFAGKAGVPDSSRFANCLVDGSVSGRIDADRNAGEALGIQGTPMFLVDSMKVQGVLPFSAIDSILRLRLLIRPRG